MQSPSFIRETSRAEFVVGPGEVAPRAAGDRIVLRYWWPHDPPFQQGQAYTFRFTRDGRFFDIQEVPRYY